MWGGINDWLGAGGQEGRAKEEDVDNEESDITTSFWSALNMIKEKVRGLLFLDGRRPVSDEVEISLYLLKLFFRPFLYAVLLTHCQTITFSPKLTTHCKTNIP